MSDFEKAILSEDLVTLKKLFENGKYDVNKKHKFYGAYTYEYPLVYSVLANKPSSVKFLLDKGANINVKINGKIPLLYGCCRSPFFAHPGVDVIKLLVDYGSDTEYKDRSGKDFLNLLEDRLSEEEIKDLRTYILCSMKPTKRG